MQIILPYCSSIVRDLLRTSWAIIDPEDSSYLKKNRRGSSTKENKSLFYLHQEVERTNHIELFLHNHGQSLCWKRRILVHENGWRSSHSLRTDICSSPAWNCSTISMSSMQSKVNEEYKGSSFFIALTTPLSLLEIDWRSMNAKRDRVHVSFHFNSIRKELERSKNHSGSIESN